MDMLYTLFDEERIADKVVEKINKAKEARKAKEASMKPPPQPQYTAPQYSQQHIALFEEKIREDERKKMTAQLKQQKIQKLQNASNKYFDALPPVSLGNDSAWDNLFKPR